MSVAAAIITNWTGWCCWPAGSCCTLNVGTIIGKGRDMGNMIKRRKVDIRRKAESRNIKAGFKLFYHNVARSVNSVEVKTALDRIMSLKLEIKEVMNAVSCTVMPFKPVVDPSDAGTGSIFLHDGSDGVVHTVCNLSRKFIQKCTPPLETRLSDWFGGLIPLKFTLAPPIIQSLCEATTTVMWAETKVEGNDICYPSVVCRR